MRRQRATLRSRMSAHRQPLPPPRTSRRRIRRPIAGTGDGVPRLHRPWRLVRNRACRPRTHDRAPWTYSPSSRLRSGRRPAAARACASSTPGPRRRAALIALQDARDAQPVSHMVLQLDNGSGGLDRIRVGLRGAAVGATIDMRDPAAAGHVADNIHQLAASLQSRGLDPDSLRVRVTAAAGQFPAADLSRVVAASGDPGARGIGTIFAQASGASSRSRGDSHGQRPAARTGPSRHRAEERPTGRSAVTAPITGTPPASQRPPSGAARNPLAGLNDTLGANASCSC